MKIPRILGVMFLLAAPLMISGCATLDKNECASVSWYDLGLRDGQSGQTSIYVAKHVKACAKHGIPVDEQSWRTGWDSGIRVYCTPENGLNVGSQGGHYADSCPADQALLFRGAYDVGRAYHNATRERDRIYNEISTLKSDASREKDLAKKNAIQSEIFILQNELFAAERQVEDAQYDVQRYRENL